MKKKVTIALFAAGFASLAVIYICTKIFYKPEAKKTTSTVVIPQVKSDTASSVTEDLGLDDDSSLISLVPLNSDETLIGVVSMDFDGDGFDDQVNAIKTAMSPYIQLLVGLYSPATSTYERNSVIATEIVQVRSFSYTGLDITGEHKNALVYQGFAENGDAILQAFFIVRRGTNSYLNKIADFRGDGTIFIQQLDRYDSYERSNAVGLSFPIWVYTTDTAKPGSTDQLQIKYDWEHDEGKYVQKQVIRVAGSRVAAKELARIQDGTIETFAKFLDSLWYKVENTGENLYVFFDYASGEIIFFKDDVEEIYKWVHSNIRRNGIYISAVNQEIENLQRRINISLINIDEISIRSQDDVRLIINESNVWDGNYKKVSFSLVSKSGNASDAEKKIKETMKSSPWKNSEGTVIKFAEGTYTVKTDSLEAASAYTFMKLDSNVFVQFKKDSAVKLFSGIYLVTPVNADSIMFTPYSVGPDGYYKIESRTIILNKFTEEN